MTTRLDAIAARLVGLATRASGDVRMVWREALAFHLVMQLLGLVMFAPLISGVAEWIVARTGEPVITNFDIARFVLSPVGAGFVLVLAAVATALLLAEFAGHSWIAGHAMARRPVTVLATVALVLRRLPRLMALSTRIFVRLIVLLLPLIAVAGIVAFAMLGEQDINYYLAENPIEWRRAKLIVGLTAVCCAVLVAWQLVRWAYAVPILLFDGASPREALAASMRMTKGRVVAIAGPLVLWWLVLTGVSFVITWVCWQIAAASFVWAGIEVARVLPLVALFVTVALVGAFLHGGLQFAGQQFLVTRMYGEQRDPGRWTVPANLERDDQRARGLARVAIRATLALLLLALGVGWFMVSRLDFKTDVVVTAHRGASLYAPENTMAAFRAALDAGATYVELDVQHTRDGRVVVLHDRDFMRVGSDPRRVGELTAAELAAIDVGGRFGAAFTGERAPLLEDVIELARGRMKINVELKYNVPDAMLAPAVIELLRQEDFLDQVVITSLDPAALRQVEDIEPRLQTGHIVTAAVGDVIRTPADFLSLSSARATPAFIRRAHASGKQVHAWTVNEPEVMLRMIEAGVDNVITDDPALLAQVIRARNALTTSEALGLRLRVLFSRAPPELIDPSAVAPL